MGLHAGFRDGLIFTSDLFFRYQGAHSCVPNRTSIIMGCHAERKPFVEYCKDRVLNHCPPLPRSAVFFPEITSLITARDIILKIMMGGGVKVG